MLESITSNKFTYKKISQEEQQSRGILGRLVGIIADTRKPTRNGRLYPKELWENVFNNDIMKEKIANHLVVGELGHPENREEADLEKVAICLSEQPKIAEDGKIYGVFDILSTPNGRILKSLCDYGCNIGVSSRGAGDLIDGPNGEEVDPDTYTCECWDAVIVPAVKEARMQYVTESLDKKRYNKTLKQSLRESLSKEKEEDRKIVSESLSTLGINLSEGTVEKAIKERNKKKHLKLDPGLQVMPNLNPEGTPAGIGNVSMGMGESLIEEDEEETQPAEPETTAKIDTTNYKGYGIDKNVYKEGEYTVQVDGDDVWFDNIDDAKAFIDTLEPRDTNERLISKLRDSQGINESLTEGLDPDTKLYCVSGDYTDSLVAAKCLKLLGKYINGFSGSSSGSPDIKELNYVSEEEAKEQLRDFIDRNFSGRTPDEAKELLEEGCNSKGCSHKRAKEVDNVKSDGIVAEFQEALQTIKKLEADNLSLQEQLSVSNAKEVRLRESLNHYKQATVRLSDTAKKVKPLKEKLSESNNKLSASKLKLTEAKNDNSALAEERKNLIEKVERLSNQLDNTSKQLDESNDLVSQYRSSYRALKETYFQVKAESCGLKKEDVRKKLGESYKIKDIDSMCNEMSRVKSNMNKLPFRLTEDTRITFKPSENEYIGNSGCNDDIISDTLLQMLEK